MLKTTPIQRIHQIRGSKRSIPITKPAGIHLTLFYLSGGLIQFLIFGLMSLHGKDRETKIANRMTAIIGLAEALVEPIKNLRLIGLGASLGIIIAFTYLAYEISRINKISTGIAPEIEITSHPI